MKAISLKQPYAELILLGRKKIELRKWNTKFRGEFLIHASKNPDKESMGRFGFKRLPLGCVVGKARLVEVKKYDNAEELAKDKRLHLASGEWGSYGFILKNVKRVKPIECRGALGFWELQKNI